MILEIIVFTLIFWEVNVYFEEIMEFAEADTYANSQMDFLGCRASLGAKFRAAMGS